MTERYIDINELDAAQVGDALSAEVQQARDIAHGDGHAVTVGDGKAVVEIFPESRAARITTENARVEVFRIPGVAINVDDGRVAFDHGTNGNQSRLVVRATGDVHLHPFKKPETLFDTPASGSKSPEGVQRPRDASEATGQDAEKEPVTLQGRLGRDPWFADGETPKAGFPLAVNNDQGRATWHRVVVFGELAQQVIDKKTDVRKGRLVDVTGEEVLREDGGKKFKEFHATTVARVRSTPARPRQQRSLS